MIITSGQPQSQTICEAVLGSSLPGKQPRFEDVQLDLVHQRGDFHLLRVVAKSNLAGSLVVEADEALHVDGERSARDFQPADKIERKLVIVAAGEVIMLGGNAVQAAVVKFAGKGLRDDRPIVHVGAAVNDLDGCGLRRVDRMNFGAPLADDLQRRVVGFGEHQFGGDARPRHDGGDDAVNRRPPTLRVKCPS